MVAPLVALLLGLAPACSSGESSASPSDDTTSTTRRSTSTTTTRPDVDADVAFPPVIGALGDSLLAGAEPELRDELGERDLAAHAVVGLRTEDAGAGLAEVLLTKPAGLVVVLGTNNVLDGNLVEADLQAVRSMATAVSERPCVWWVDLTTSTPDAGFNERARQLNAEIEAQAARIDALEVIRWSQAVAAHPEWVALDSVHLTSEGDAALAAMITDSLRVCSGTAIPG